MVALDDFTAENGATVLVPGSHLWDDAKRPSRDQTIPAIMPAGSMLYFLNTLWHGGGSNSSIKGRRSMTIQYCQPWIRPIENMIVAIGWENLDAIPKKLLGLLGFTTKEFMGHVDGRAPRTGVELRKKRLIEWARVNEANEKSAGSPKL